MLPVRTPVGPLRSFFIFHLCPFKLLQKAFCKKWSTASWWSLLFVQKGFFFFYHPVKHQQHCFQSSTARQWVPPYILSRGVPRSSEGPLTAGAVGLHWVTIATQSHCTSTAKCLVSSAAHSHHCSGVQAVYVEKLNLVTSAYGRVAKKMTFHRF